MEKTVGISTRSPRFLPPSIGRVWSANGFHRGSQRVFAISRDEKQEIRGAVRCHLSFPASYAAFRFDAACHPRFRADATTTLPSPPPFDRWIAKYARNANPSSSVTASLIIEPRKPILEERKEKRNSASWLRSIYTASFHDDEAKTDIYAWNWDMRERSIFFDLIKRQ